MFTVTYRYNFATMLQLMGFGDVDLSAPMSPEVAAVFGGAGMASTSFIIFRLTGVLETLYPIPYTLYPM
jgi:hypothetical protein